MQSKLPYIFGAIILGILIYMGISLYNVKQDLKDEREKNINLTLAVRDSIIANIKREIEQRQDSVIILERTINNYKKEVIYETAEIDKTNSIDSVIFLYYKWRPELPDSAY